MSDITLINDSEQSSLVTNGLAKNGELYLKKAGSTNAGAIVAYDNGTWRTFANEASAGAWNGNTYSLDLDGVDDYIDMGSTFQSTFRSNNSVSLWMKRDRTTGEAPAGVNDTSGQSYFYIDGSSLHFIYKAGSTRVIANGSVSWNTTDWFHVVGTVEQSGSDVVTKVYLNGSLVDSTTGVATLSDYTATDTYVAGRRSSSFFPFQGLIDEVAILNTNLSASDVTAIYNSGVPDDLSSYSPVGWWRMGDNDSGTGTTITDQGSGGNDGTLVNGPSFSSDVPS